MAEGKPLSAHSIYMRQWRARKGEQWRTYMRAWREKNRERIKATRSAHYEQHRDEEIAAAVRYTTAHYDRHLFGCRAVNANKRYPGRLTRADVAFIFDRDNYTCHWCSKRNLDGRDLTLEHLKPMNDRQHIVAACLSCNSSRRSLTEAS